ncbi:MAG: DUF4147 domain-containing protein [Phycisphaerae bacterium]|nr:DUF4147 domain-containing protein [Phycisphaerae bacterium]
MAQPPYPSINDAERDLKRLVRTALEAADAGAAVRANWPDELRDQAPGSVKLVAIGKASLEMAAAAAALLGPGLASGVLTTVPERFAAASIDPRLIAYPADHPLPTERNLSAARAVRAFVEGCTPAETLLVLISGGGSAHLTLPAEGLSLDDLRAINGALQRAGADIRGLNTVRKHTEGLKGGRLATLCRAGKIEALILSDVIGDDLPSIASGPTAWDPTTFAEAAEVLSRHGCEGVAPAVTRFIEEGAAGLRPETPKQEEPRFRTVCHRIVASNRDVVRAVRDEARRLGYREGHAPGIVGDALEGARSWATRLRHDAERAWRGDSDPPQALVSGGEPTVRVARAGGRGGPSQTVALAAWCGLADLPNVAIMACSTDGIDGNSDAAGAILAPGALGRMRSAGVDPRECLRRHDATACLDAIGAAVRTGPTGTNLNHVFVALVYPGPR